MSARDLDAQVRAMHEAAERASRNAWAIRQRIAEPKLRPDDERYLKSVRDSGREAARAASDLLRCLKAGSS